MLLDFFKKHKTKTLLIAAGFLVVGSVAAATAWVYFSFLVSHDDFLDMAPAQAVIFWHRSAGGSVDETWLRDISERMLSKEASGQAETLFRSVAPKSSETSFAVLPGFEDFIFWGKLSPADFNTLKGQLEEENFNYIVEDEGKVAITNTKFALKEVLAALSQKNFSLADQKGRLAAWNRASRRFPVQLYLGNGFKWENLSAPGLKADFWEINQLKITKNETGYLYLLATDNGYLSKKAGDYLKNVLAVILPETREKKLPDGVIVREIVANPDAFVFGKTKISGREVEYLSVPDLKREFFLSSSGKQTILSTSKDLLANFLVRLGRQPDYYGENIIDLAKKGAKWLTSDFEGAIFGISLPAAKK